MGAQDNKTLLMQAAADGHVSGIEKLLTETKTDINAVDDEGHTALAYAILHAQPEAFQCLYENNADTDLFDSHGASIFMMIQTEKEKAQNTGNTLRFQALEQINSTYTRRYNYGMFHSLTPTPEHLVNNQSPKFKS